MHPQFCLCKIPTNSYWLYTFHQIIDSPSARLIVSRIRTLSFAQHGLTGAQADMLGAKGLQSGCHRSKRGRGWGRRPPCHDQCSRPAPGLLALVLVDDHTWRTYVRGEADLEKKSGCEEHLVFVGRQQLASAADDDCVGGRRERGGLGREEVGSCSHAGPGGAGRPRRTTIFDLSNLPRYTTLARVP
jgi:hypothetical protein